uniref:Uncharacterized protein n=1 Tax=viral metagenome TaxID=1070528 RepID=A0A6C0BN27_9ZZZZ
MNLNWVFTTIFAYFFFAVITSVLTIVSYYNSCEAVRGEDKTHVVLMMLANMIIPFVTFFVFVRYDSVKFVAAITFILLMAMAILNVVVIADKFKGQYTSWLYFAIGLNATLIAFATFLFIFALVIKYKSWNEAWHADRIRKLEGLSKAQNSSVSSEIEQSLKFLSSPRGTEMLKSLSPSQRNNVITALTSASSRVKS